MDQSRRTIRQLDQDVVKLIAAGEVIERPSSVVKELIENALDAGSRHIEVKLVNGGLTSILVRDDGSGIPSDEIPLLLNRHTTNKIESEADLGRILTLGFRGEALYSIAAVSELILSTRFHTEETGSRLTSKDGQTTVEVISWHGGTQVESLGLFSSIPARRKFLKSASAEYSKIAELVSAYALAYPNICWKLSHNSRMTINSPGTGRLEDALLAIYGPDIARHMIQVEQAAHDSVPSERIRISGVVSSPDITRARRTDQIFFVNGRLIRNQSLSAALERAYDPLLSQGRHPLAVLMIECDPAEVDVNVHPHKTEVRFAHSTNVISAVYKAVKTSLTRIANIPKAAVFRTESEISNETNFIDEITGEVGLTNPKSSTSLMPDFKIRENDASWAIRQPKRHHSGTWQQPVESNSGQKPVVETTRNTKSATEHSYLSLNELNVPQYLKPSSNTFQFANTYIIYNDGRCVYIIDQHNFHERILYGKFRSRSEKSDTYCQTLLFPLQISLPASLAALVHEHMDEIETLGFQIEEFSEAGATQSFVLRAVPQELGSIDPVTAFIDCLEKASQDEDIREPGGFRKAFEINLACKSAIKAGQILSDDEIAYLVDHLPDGSFHTCPHGRPAVVTLDEEWFRRIFRRS